MKAQPERMVSGDSRVPDGSGRMLMRPYGQAWLLRFDSAHPDSNGHPRWMLRRKKRPDCESGRKGGYQESPEGTECIIA